MVEGEAESQREAGWLPLTEGVARALLAPLRVPPATSAAPEEEEPLALPDTEPLQLGRPLLPELLSDTVALEQALAVAQAEKGALALKEELPEEDRLPEAER